MAGITWWNLADGTAVEGENEAQGALMTKELEPKLAYRELERLIHEEWKTHADGQTDQNGVYHVRGFRGRYLVRIGRGNTWVVRTLAVDGNEPALLEVVWETQN